MILDRERPPVPTPRPPVAPPGFERHRLDDGLEVLAASRPQFPLVRMDLLFPTAGAHHDPPDKAGVATLTSLLLDEAERGQTATETAERLGGSLFTGATWNTAVANVTLLSKHLSRGLELLMRVGYRSHVTFPTEQFTRLRGQRLANLVQQRADRSALADHHLAKAMYGDSVYGRPLHGDFESIRGIERDDLVQFHRRHYRRAGSALVAVGDLNPAEFFDQVEKTLGPGDRRSPMPPPSLEPSPVEARPVVVVDEPSAAHVELRLGQPLLPYGHPDTFWLNMTNTILGGMSTSRLHVRLRETEGWTYSIRSRISGRIGPSPFEIATAVPTEQTGRAAGRILEEVERFLTDGPTEEELDQARRHLEGNLTVQLQAIEQWVNKLSLIPVFGLPLDHFEHYLDAIRSATKDEVTTTARKHLKPDRLSIVVVGPAKKLVPQLTSYGPLTEHDPHTLL